MKGLKVLSSDEMRRVEALAFSAKVKEDALMKAAGKKVALQAIHFLVSSQKERTITLLAGKGKNGADGFAAAVHLLHQGFSLNALLVGDLDEAAPLCQKEAEHFLKLGGTLLEIFNEKNIFLPKSGLLIDALLGTGFSGEVTKVMRALIEKANGSSLPILSVDIPSGLDGNTGEIHPVAIRAKLTVSFSLPKVGFFIREGWNHVGKLIVEDIGLPQEFLEKAQETFFLLDEETVEKELPKVERSCNKYERGSVVAVAGSLGMEGAAKLSSMASLRSGAGIVKLFLPQDVRVESSSFPDELVKKFWKNDDFKELLEECHKASSIFIGPGLGRNHFVDRLVTTLVSAIDSPTVLDADALFVLAHHPHLTLPPKTILTPHHQEMERLLGEKRVQRDLSFLRSCQEYCEKKKVLLVLKGGPTFILHPHEKPIVSLRGDPAMATAGSGDVLTGIIAALLAQKLSPYKAALLGVHLHGICGEIAALEKGSYSTIASDLVDLLPKAFQQMRH
jgi:ADP-dependent NAD(P)H-hydrate dehydratase / NAD(P)H-hydrate epimerase